MFRERSLLLAVVRTGAWIFASFGLGALILAAVGIYGVKSYLVSRRTREIGIRIALGAEPRRVVGMVVGEGLLLVGLGLVAGVVLSVMTGTLVRGALFQGRARSLPSTRRPMATRSSRWPRAPGTDRPTTARLERWPRKPWPTRSSAPRLKPPHRTVCPPHAISARFLPA
jgi:ABC-type antimicrobial peptide transport system permease subunit